MTLDGLFYTFNGWGEYVLVEKTDDANFGIQGRLTPIAANATATAITAIAVKDGSNTISAYLGALEGVIFFANGQMVSNIPVGSYYQTGDGKAFIFAYATKYTIVLSSGLNIDVTGEVSMLNAVIILPASFSGKTKGLLGTWDNNQANDLTPKVGSALPVSATQQEIYYQFGSTYATTAGTTLFSYPDGLSWTDFNTHASFTPAFTTPQFASEGLKSQAMSACATASSIDACLYDVAQTGDLRSAQVSVKSGSVFQTFAAVSVQPPTFTSPPTTMEVSYKQAVSITYTVTDPQGQAITLTATTKPTGTTVTGKTVAFTVTSAMYVAKAVTPVTVIATNTAGSFSDPVVTTFTIKYSTCDNVAQVVEEASLDLAAYCLTDNTCGTACSDVMTRLVALTCVNDIETQAGTLFTNARTHCCAVNPAISCTGSSNAGGLGQGAIIGIAVGASVGGILIIGLIVFLVVRSMRAEKGFDKKKEMEMK